MAKLTIFAGGMNLTPALQVTALLCALMLALVVAWTSWSVRKHGWRKRSLRRYSYLLFILLLTLRLAWCAACLFFRDPAASREALDDADGGGVLFDEGALRSLAVVVVGRLCFCAHFCVFSMLVCGWADSTWMMMSGRWRAPHAPRTPNPPADAPPPPRRRAAQPLALRASTIFYYLGTPFVVVNTICVLVSIGTLVPPLLCRDGSPECAQLANTWNWWGVAAMASFSLVLALAAVPSPNPTARSGPFRSTHCSKRARL